MARIVLATFGSYGDVHPYLAIGRGLLARGHDVCVAAPSTYGESVTGEGLDFRATRPDVDFEDAATFRRAMDQRRGPEVIVREIVVPALRDSFEDLRSACEGSDLLTSHVLTYAAPILGELTGLRWVSTVLSPMVFASAHEPPALSPIPGFAKLHVLGPGIVGLLWRLMKRAARSWSEPVRSFRRELGLPEGPDPLWEGQFSPHGTLALFSPTFAAPQPDWPERTVACGFPFHDRDFGGDADEARLNEFLAAGEPPVVFSLGSSAVHSADDFHTVAAAATRRARMRAVLVTGDSRQDHAAGGDILAVRSAAMGRLLARSALFVHAGGIGSVALALRESCPQIVVPFAHDHFDNGRRITRLGAGAVLSRRRSNPARLAKEMTRLLADPVVARATERLARSVAAEDGVAAACDALEARLDHVPRAGRRG